MLISVGKPKLSMPKPQPMPKTATGMRALSIWMKDTLRYRYAALLSHKVPANSAPIGTIACNGHHTVNDGPVSS